MSDTITADSDRGLALGTPCQNEHSIHFDDATFWIRCGDTELARTTFPSSSLDYREQPRRWSELVMARHKIACWKQLARDARDVLDSVWRQYEFAEAGRMVTAIDAALREGEFANG